jgi:hypothetical protein
MNNKNKSRIFNDLNTISKIAKETHKRYRIIDDDTLSSIQALSKLTVPKIAIDTLPNFENTQATVDALKSINKNLKRVFGEYYLPQSYDSRLNEFPITEELSNALKSISKQVRLMANNQRNWRITKDFKDVSYQTNEFSENLVEDVNEEQEEQFQTLIQLISEFVKEHGATGLLIIDIILRFAGIHQYYEFLEDKPEFPTKQEVNQISLKQDSVINYINLITEQLNNEKEFRRTNRACEVKLKPKPKTLLLSKLPKDFEVVVIRINHKWAYISYFDPKDNLPQTGWILKKYLNKVK